MSIVDNPCPKCVGTGHVAPNSNGETECFCCKGKGHRTEEDSRRCQWYCRLNPEHADSCVEYMSVVYEDEWGYPCPPPEDGTWY